MTHETTHHDRLIPSIFKKGVRYECSNHRRTGLIPKVAKVLASITSCSLYRFARVMFAHDKPDFAPGSYTDQLIEMRHKQQS